MNFLNLFCLFFFFLGFWYIVIFRGGRTWERESESNLFSRVNTSVYIPSTVIVPVLGFGFSFV